MTEAPKQAKDIPFNPNLPTALFVLRDDGGCGFYRCMQPATNLRTMGLFNTITDMYETTPKHILQADIVIFQCTGTLASIEGFSFAMKEKKTVVVELDDLITSISPSNIAYDAWQPRNLLLHRALDQMKAAHALTVSTPQLAREFMHYNANIHILPNYLARNKWDELDIVKKKDGVIRIGWAGGNAHTDDLKMVAKVLEKIVKEYKGKVKFELMGLTKGELQTTFHLQEFMDKCPKCDYQGEIMAFGGESLDNYPTVLASFGWDIGIAPVVNTAFNNAKSDLKLKEYAAVRLPAVASRVTPYAEARANGCQVLLADNFKEWYNNLKTLIDDPELRDKMTKENEAWVQRYWIEDNIKHYADIYKQLISSNPNPHGNRKLQSSS